MDLDKDEIAEALAHHKEMLRLHRRRLRELERKQAQYGINTPPEVITEILDLSEQIQRHEAEAARLQTEAAVDKLPVAEAEYRAMLAESWDTPDGLPPGVTRAARLELARLRLGINHEKASELEREVRQALSNERIELKLDEIMKLITILAKLKSDQDTEQDWEDFRSIFGSIRPCISLDMNTVVQWFVRMYDTMKMSGLIKHEIEFDWIKKNMLRKKLLSGLLVKDTVLVRFISQLEVALNVNTTT